MKSKEQVKKHLREVGYSKDSISKIMGFLIGVGLKDAEETFSYKVGDKTFSYFHAWFNTEEASLNTEIVEKDIQILEEIVNDILERMEQNEDDFCTLRNIMAKYGLTEVFDDVMKN